MKRRDFIAGFAGASVRFWKRQMAVAVAVTMALLLPHTGNAQQRDKTAHIGFLTSSSAASSQERIACLHRGLRQAGWIEGRNLTIEYRHSEANPERMAALAAELVGLSLDLVLAGGTPASLAMQRETRDVPVVFVMVSDPVASGIVTSLARPNGNITGFPISFLPPPPS